MRTLTQWYRRMVAVLVGAALGLAIPAMAWAQTGDGGDNLAKVKVGKALGGVAGLGAVCCLLVVAIIVVVVLLIAKRRR